MVELVIKMPEEDYDDILNGEPKASALNWSTFNAIRDGVLLPKGHGRLKDVDKIVTDGISKGFCDWYDEMKSASTIIEADKEE